MRHTKIVATVGPACHAADTLDALVDAGVEVFRLNFSHGSHEGHAAVFEAIRAAAWRAGRPVAILQDLSGPKIRTGTLVGGTPIQLREGDELRLAEGDAPGDGRRVYTTYRDLIESAVPGDRLLLDDGRLELRVNDRAGSELITAVVHGGTLAEHKGINAPGVRLPVSAITPKDEDDLTFGLKLCVDIVSLCFLQI